MKFGDVIIAAASVVLFGLIFDAILMAAFVPMNNGSASDPLAYIISFLVVSVIVGYVFALRIQDESRIRAIGSIVILSAFALILFTAAWVASPFASPWARDSINNVYTTTATSGWTDYDLAAYSALLFSLDVIIALVLSFIGLYAGSMLKKPKKA